MAFNRDSHTFDEKIFWSIQTTAKMLDISISSVHRLAKNDPSFPKKVFLGTRIIGWPSEDIREWLKMQRENIS